MEREAIARAIRLTDNEIETVDRQIASYKEKYQILEEFEKKNHQSVELFNMSIDRRRRNIQSVSWMRETSKLASGFMDTVLSALNGPEYAQAAAQISMIEETIQCKKRRFLRKWNAWRQECMR